MHLPGLVEAETVTGKARAILNAVGDGELPADVGLSMMNALGGLVRAIELDELQARLAALESAAGLASADGH